MKYFAKFCIAIVLILSSLTVGYAAAWRTWEDEPGITRSMLDSVQSIITAEKAEQMARERIEDAEVALDNYSFTNYQYVDYQGLENETVYHSENAELAWRIIYYPKDWNNVLDYNEVICYFGDVDGLTGKLQYAGKCLIFDDELETLILRNGKRIYSYSHINYYLEDYLEEGELDDDDVQYDVSEYFIGNGKVRVVKPLLETETINSMIWEYYTVNLKDEKVSDSLTFRTYSDQLKRQNYCIKYAVSEKEYRLSDTDDTLWISTKDDNEAIRLDKYTLAALE